MSGVDKARWRQLSPLLDELLDLDAAARAERLTALRAEDAAVADRPLGAFGIVGDAACVVAEAVFE